MNNKNIDFQKFVKILRKETETYEKLLDILKDKQDAIIVGEVDELRKMVDKEQKCIKEGMELAEKRNSIIEDIKRSIGTTQKIDFDVLINIVDSDLSMKMKNFRHRLRDVMDQVNTVNQENKMLLNYSLEHVRGLASLFLSVSDEEDEVYDENGSIESPDDNTKMLDFQI